jgi:hypothetical protein
MRHMRRLQNRGVGLVLAGLIFIGGAYGKGPSHAMLLYAGIGTVGIGLLLILVSYWWWRRLRQKDISS